MNSRIRVIVFQISGININDFLPPTSLWPEDIPNISFSFYYAREKTNICNLKHLIYEIGVYLFQMQIYPLGNICFDFLLNHNVSSNDLFMGSKDNYDEIFA